MLPPAGRADDAIAFRILANRLTIQSKHVMQEMLRIRDVPAFYRTPYDASEGSPLSASDYVWNHGKVEFVLEPLEAAGELAAKAGGKAGELAVKAGGKAKELAGKAMDKVNEHFSPAVPAPVPVVPIVPGA